MQTLPTEVHTLNIVKAVPIQSVMYAFSLSVQKRSSTLSFQTLVSSLFENHQINHFKHNYGLACIADSSSCTIAE